MKLTLLVLCGTALSAMAPAPARAGDLQAMMRNAGEWEMTMTGGAMPTTTRKGCYRGDETVADLTTSGMKDCSQKTVSITAAFATVDAVCTIESVRVTVHATARPTGDAAFHADGRLHIDGLQGIPGIKSDMPVSIDAHRVGPCQPGDDRM